MSSNKVEAVTDLWFVPVHTDDFERETAEMSAEQVGAYFLLLLTAWRAPSRGHAPCTIIDDDAVLATTSRLGSRWRTAGKVVRSHFTVCAEHPGRLRSERLFDLWVEKHALHQENVLKGRAGGSAKAQGPYRGKNQFNADRFPPAQMAENGSRASTSATENGSRASTSATENGSRAVAVQSSELRDQEKKTLPALGSAGESLSTPEGSARRKELQQPSAASGKKSSYIVRGVAIWAEHRDGAVMSFGKIGSSFKALKDAGHDEDEILERWERYVIATATAAWASPANFAERFDLYDGIARDKNGTRRRGPSQPFL